MEQVCLFLQVGQLTQGQACTGTSADFWICWRAHQQRRSTPDPDGGGGETVTMVAQVVNCITPDYPPQDLRAIKDLPFMRDLPLADPDFGSSRRVDLLLGICGLEQSAPWMNQSPLLTVLFGPGTLSLAGL